MSGDTSEISNLRAHLEGWWEYRYEVLSGPGFEGRELARGGVLTIFTSTDWSGVNIDIHAWRMWGRSETVQSFLLDREMPWNYLSKLIYFSDSQLGFTSFLDDPAERAYTRTYFNISDDSRLESGEFTYFPDAKEIVRGSVSLRKIEDDARLLWVPGVEFLTAEKKTSLERQSSSAKSLSLSASG